MTVADHKVAQHLAQFISDHKRQFVEKVLNARTRHITVILEDIYQSQNASAVIRTAECMGLQDIHIVENTAKYHLNIRVLKGSYKWMDLHRYRDRSINNTAVCYEALKSAGYKILVADPSPEGTSIHDVNVEEGKVALLFGNELRGVSTYALDHADQRIRVPMYGFTESFNISVSAAVCLTTLVTKLHAAENFHGLTAEEKDAIRLDWYKKMVRNSHIIEKEFLRTNQ